ncbi:hypothetical protein K1719_016614 [Acacia pycnantha]|nr:hypothetical protein K1719_016614 [Acacia pycnantha]
MKAMYLVVSLLAFASVHVLAYDPSPLQDFCVALNDSVTKGVFVNGKFCKDPMAVKAEDFYSSTYLDSRQKTLPASLSRTLLVGFVGSNQNQNRLFTKVLNKGDVFMFPIGLIHFQQNVGYGNAVAFAGLSSQNAGVIPIAKSVFGSDPPISPEVLQKAFQVDQKIIDLLQKPFQAFLYLRYLIDLYCV